MSTTLGEGVLDWMLRRLGQAVQVRHDLVLVRDKSGALADVGPSVDARGETWRVVKVTGELTLRDALPEADRLIAIVPDAFPPLPLDLAGRAYLGRILEPRAEDVVAAVSGRFCEALVDEGVSQAVFDSIDTLRATAGRWSLGELVSAREVRSVLVGAELGAARLDRERDWELLARWLIEGAPTFRAVTLVRAALEEAQPRTGAWLAWALTDGTLRQLCTAGALLASSKGAELAPTIPGLAASDHGAVVDLVDSALRAVWHTSASRAKEALVDAERAARGVDLDASKHRLLRVPLEGALSRAATLAADGRPADDVTIEGLKRNLHAPELADAIDAVADLSRLARFDRLSAPTAGGMSAWFTHASRNVAWSDLAHRRLRRSLDGLPAWLADPARRGIEQWLLRRDALNSTFATSLAADWAEVARSTDARHPVALHQLSRVVVRRLVDDGTRVFLMVLDGCDLASFLEILDSLPPDRRVGLTLPEVRDAVLRDDLSALGAWNVAISPLPTVTSHSRRALFAGEIPGNAALDDTESAAANATADKRAWERNTALGDTRRALFLKGDLGPNGQPLLDALRQKDARVLAAVYNGVDDALSSKETTALPRWSLGALGAGAAEVVQVAIDEGWCVLVTADHGHTPFVSSDRKVAPSGLGQRFSAEASEGSVAFTSGPLPRQPLHLLTGFGGWFGHQRRGFHGGAGIEEVVVPLAFLGRVRGEQEGRPRAPAWWWSGEAEAPPVAPAPHPTVHVAAPPLPLRSPGPTRPMAVLDPRLASLLDDERRVVVLLMENQSVRVSVIAKHLGKNPMRLSGFMQQLVDKLYSLGCPCVVADNQTTGDRMYFFRPVERENG